ncbi:MAG TPA: cytochrome c [Allosphingosinicella sp.]|nr:cytochrome c [Allosphingosinicella sp.]
MRRAIPGAATLSLILCVTNGPAMPGRAAAAAVEQGPAAPTVAQLIAARRAGMHMAATLLLTDIRRIVAGREDVRQHQHEPDGIALWAAAIPGLFPAGSRGESRARPEIWQNRADFERKALDLQQAAEELARRGAAGDTAGYAEQARVVQAACNACHTLYRQPG